MSSLRPVVCNASPLIAFQAIDRLDLLRDVLGEPFWVPEAVALEVSRTVPLPDWISVQSLTQPMTAQILRSSLGFGEREAISLALLCQASMVVLDDLSARNYTERLGMNVVGSVGVVVRAKHLGLLSQAGPTLVELRDTGLYISDRLFEKALRTAGE